MAFNTELESKRVNTDEGGDAGGSSPASPPTTTGSMEHASAAGGFVEPNRRNQATEFFGDCLLFMAQAVKSGAAVSAFKETIRALRRPPR